MTSIMASASMTYRRGLTHFVLLHLVELLHQGELLLLLLVVVELLVLMSA
eukprot:COSAG01_NODE_40_length_32708_cov_25.641234_19_plen_50_part_00